LIRTVSRRLSLPLQAMCHLGDSTRAGKHSLPRSFRWPLVQMQMEDSFGRLLPFTSRKCIGQYWEESESGILDHGTRDHTKAQGKAVVDLGDIVTVGDECAQHEGGLRIRLSRPVLNLKLSVKAALQSGTPLSCCRDQDKGCLKCTNNFLGCVKWSVSLPVR